MLFPTIEFAIFFALVFPVTWLLNERNTAKKWFLVAASCVAWVFFRSPSLEAAQAYFATLEQGWYQSPLPRGARNLPQGGRQERELMLRERGADSLDHTIRAGAVRCDPSDSGPFSLVATFAARCRPRRIIGASTNRWVTEDAAIVSTTPAANMMAK
jgi:hypothetical protein